MAIHLISNEHSESIRTLFSESKSTIKIITPFVGREMANLVIAAKRQNRKLNIQLITRFYSGDFIAGLSRIRSVKELHECGVEIYALKGLNTKLYLFDSNTALLGSANLTADGIGFNRELSLRIEDEPEVNTQMLEHFDNLVEEILENGSEYLLTADTIEEELIYVTARLELHRNQSTTYVYNKKFGAELFSYEFEDVSPTPEFVEDPIQAVISVRDISDLDIGNTIWLKFIGDADSRIGLNEKYRPHIERGYPAGIASYPSSRKPSSVKEGDYVYIAAISMDERGRSVWPYIVGRGITEGFKPRNIATPRMLASNPWMERFKNYCAFTSFEYIDANIGECIPLVEVLQELGAEVYATTTGQNISYDKLLRQHAQKAHLRLTPLAKEFIDDAFEKAAAKYGIRKLTSERKPRAARSDVTEDMIKKAYDTAKLVHSGDITRAGGRRQIVAQAEMKESTATYHIDVFIKMREAKMYARTLNPNTTRYYLQNIFQDYGKEGLEKALEATKGHVEYFASLPSGSKQQKIVDIINEFEAKL